MCRTLIWSSKPPRLSWTRLTLPKSRGGLGVPDIQKYHWSCHLTRIADWHLHHHNKSWIHLEQVFVKIPIRHLRWINPQKIPKEVQSHPLIGATLLNFKAACKHMQLRPSPGPMTPLEDNPDFEPGLTLHTQTTDLLRPRPLIRQFFLDEQLMTHHVMSSKFPDHHIPFYKFLQIRHFIQSCTPTANIHREPSQLEHLCNSEGPQRHLISSMYTMLFSTHHIKEDKLIRSWETELQLDLSSEEWEHIFQHMHKGSINVSTQENKYKILHKMVQDP